MGLVFLVHIRKVDFDFLADREEVGVLIVIVEVLRIGHIGQVKHTAARPVVLDGLDGTVDQLLDISIAAIEPPALCHRV